VDTGFDKARLMKYQALAVKALGDPLKMRLVVLVAVTAIGAVGVYMPLSDQILQRRALVAAEKERYEVIREVELLRREIEGYKPRISAKSDTNEWVQYLLAGSREANVKLRDMESKEPQKVGPYRAVYLVVEVEGTYARLKAFMEWLEQSDRLLRVDNIRFEKRPDVVVMKLYVLGLVQKSA